MRGLTAAESKVYSEALQDLFQPTGFNLFGGGDCMGKASDIMKESELFKLVAREALQRTFNFDKAKCDTFENNYEIILAGHMVSLLHKQQQEFDESGNGRMYGEKFGHVAEA